MSRYYGYVLIDFTDGTSERVGGNRTRYLSDDGVLVVYTALDYGPDTDVRHFPLANIKSWRWEGE